MDPTIKDIARRANVSYATVSRALNAKYGVKPATRERVLAVAREMRYRPNVVARGLVKKRTHTIGLIVPDITNPFFPEVAAGVEDKARERSYGVFLCNANWRLDSESQYVALLAERRVDGVILAPISRRDRSKEYPAHLPLVYVSNAPARTRAGSVVIDNVRGGVIATRHLIERGRAPLGYVGSAEGSRTSDERLEGFRLALREAGIPYDERYVRFGDMKQQTGYNLMCEMIEAGSCPGAVFAENDLMALGCMQAVREKGLRIPDDVAVVGFDDIPFASYPEVRLTTILQPKYAMGRLAAEILIDLVETDPERRRRRKVVLEPELVVRESTGPSASALMPTVPGLTRL